MTTDLPDRPVVEAPMPAGRNGRNTEYNGYEEFRVALRGLLDAVAAARPPAAMWATGAELVTDLAAQLRAFSVPESLRIAGNDEISGDRGLLLLPPLQLSAADDQAIEGHVVFGDHFHGTNQTAHGGAVSLLFDELFGRLANSGRRPRMRTAYLHVDYRSVTPVNRRLFVRVEVRAMVGRKLVGHGELREDARLLAECECLLLALRPGQP